MASSSSIWARDEWEELARDEWGSDELGRDECGRDRWCWDWEVWWTVEEVEDEVESDVKVTAGGWCKELFERRVIWEIYSNNESI